MDTPIDEHQPVEGDAATEPPSTASLVTAAIVCSLLLSMARVFILANVFGYSAPDPESGGWTLFTTFVLLSIAAVSVILSARRDEATAISRSMAWAVGSCVLFGFVYGLFTGGIFSGVFCGLCIGCGAGYVAGINGVAPSRLASDEMKKLLGIACGGFVGFGLLGFLTPIPLVPKAVYLENRKAGEAAAASEAVAKREAVVEKGSSNLLKADAQSCAEAQNKLLPILEKCQRIKESGDGVSAAEFFKRNGQPLAERIKQLSEKHKDKEAEFNEAVKNAKASSPNGGGSTGSGMKYFTALELIALARNPARAGKELPPRFVVTGAIQEIDQHSGVFGRKSYTVRVRGRINNRGLVDTWVECEISKADGMERLEKSSYAEIEGHFDSAMSDVVTMTDCSLHKPYHDQ